ncbi:MurR/RpiR family transcriptional regulator [Lentibacillus halophilus]
MQHPFNGMKPSIVMEQHKHYFTKSEKKIHDYIESHREQVLYHSLTELSEASGVAEATVLRFFRKLGFKGFQDFKFQTAQEMGDPDEPSDDEAYTEKIKKNMVQAIENSHDIIDMASLNHCIDLIDQSDDVVLFAVGSSGIAASDMQNRLMRIGKHVHAVIDPHFQVMRASSMDEHTLVIAISLTGSTKDIIDSVDIAKSRGATVIAITNYIKSPLTQYADHVLLSSAKESPLDSGSLVAKVSQLFIIDLVCTGLTIKNYDQAEQIKRGISKNTTGKLY